LCNTSKSTKMGLSPSTLFHFTSKNRLKGILKDNFKLKYCLEKINHSEKPIKIAIPMVSFCDIKISEIIEHAKKYGYYGIGLSKEWAITKGLNPVIYLNSSSEFSNNLISTVRQIVQDKEISPTNIIHLADILRYSKIYEGELSRKGKLQSNYRFADEREWRYVPKMNDIFLQWIIEKDYDTNEKKKKANEKLQNERLTFDANQILYIFVKYDKEIEGIIKHIRNVKGEKYSMNELERLTTRILSFERIVHDF